MHILQMCMAMVDYFVVRVCVNFKGFEWTQELGNVSLRTFSKQNPEIYPNVIQPRCNEE
jgi:hypothetical protein